MHIFNPTTGRWDAWDGVLNTGDIEIGAVELKDGDSDVRADIELDSAKNALYVQTETMATEAKQDNIIQGVRAISGASSDGTVALAVADTWYAVPNSAPASDYMVVISKENAAGTVRWSFDNGGAPGATNGNKLTSDDLILHLAANEVVYFGSSNAGDDVNWTANIV